MRRLLVTGGAGFIGANFLHYWAARHPADHLTVLDVLSYAGNRHSLRALEGRPAFRFVEGDICAAPLVSKLLADNCIDTIVHFAAESHVDRSIHGADAFVRTNVVGTHTLLQCAREIWLDARRKVEGHRFHHVSTDEVYGSLDPGDPGFLESTPYDPSSPYSASKAGSDHLVRAYHRTFALNVTISNCSNNYGPYQHPEKLIPLALINMLHGRPVPVYGDGRNVRDWLYVEDHCRAIELVLERGVSGNTYNIGGNCERENIDVVRLVGRALDERFAADDSLRQRFPDAPPARGDRAESLITFVTDRPGHDRRYAMDISKIAGACGFFPRESFESGIAGTVRWFLDNEAWWRPLLNDDYRRWLDRQYAGLQVDRI